MCTKNGNTLDWKKIAEKNPSRPPPIRASHSSVFYNGKIYIFGG
jgi:hypothetical protein